MRGEATNRFGSGLSAAEALQGVGFKASLKEVAINRLGGKSPLPCSDDHLAIGRGYASGGVESLDGGAHFHIDDDTAFRVEFSTEVARDLVKVNVAAGGEQGIP